MAMLWPDSVWRATIAGVRGAANILAEFAVDQPVIAGLYTAVGLAMAAKTFFPPNPPSSAPAAKKPISAAKGTPKSTAAKSLESKKQQSNAAIQQDASDDEYDVDAVPPNTIRFHKDDKEYAALDMRFRSPFILDGYRWSTLYKFARARLTKTVDRPFRAALFAKFKQNPEIAELLLSTGDKKLEYDVYDTYWGIGQDGNGKNALGVELMRLRQHLRRRRQSSYRAKRAPLPPNVQP